MSKQQVREQFGANAAAYVASPTHAQGASLGWLVARVAPQAGWRVLDVATAAGHAALALAPHVAAVVGLDLTPEMIPLAAGLAAERGLGNLAFTVGDVEALPFDAGAFDAVTCRIAPHHFPDVGRFITEAARVLRPGGVLLVTRRQGSDAAYFLRRNRGREEFEALLAAIGFGDVRSQPWQVEYELVWATRPVQT